MKILGLLSLLFFSIPALALEVRPSDDNITQKIAQARKAQIDKVAYDLYFELEKDVQGFNGKALIKVELNHLKNPLSIDTMAKKIHSVMVNGKQLKNYPKRKGSLDIPVNSLSKKMQIEITFENDYTKSAGGFIRSKDPEDGAEYLFTDFEPYYAHNLFPCFDQPDLKAIYKLTVLAPKDWKVIHNELIEEGKSQKDKVLTVFQATPPISSYLFFLGAGPFHEWTDEYNDLPLALYARKSLAKYVDVENIFKTTKRGLKFFNNYFGHAYPFSKYGQIFIPEFAWGGMENPGAVALNERNIYKGPVPASMRAKRDNLILHEMAHMWFGDLVTMEWWNDLWLNESFATYLASIAQERGLDSDATWIAFFNTKAWGYWQDQLVTSHPIETEVPDVRTAKANFDGITYAKGASSLKQLHFFVGEEGFREGLRAYFKKFAFKNTRRSDFIDSIAKASKIDLSDWTNKWLQTAGPNRVSFEFSCKDGEVKTAEIKQKKSVSGTLSPHRARISFFQHDDNELDLMKSYDVVFSEEVTPIPAMLGSNCPDFVLPNQDDQDYALYSLDKSSLSKASFALTALSNPLSRAMLWNILNQMVRDGELNTRDYFKMALEGLKEEKDDLLLGFLLGKNSSLRNNYFLYQDKIARSEWAPQYEEVIWNRIANAKSGSSLQMAFFDYYVSFAETKESQTRLHSMLTKNEPPKGIVLDQDRRWAININLSQNGNEDAVRLCDEELKRDPSTTGKRYAFSARAALPLKAVKKSIWKEFLTSKNLTYSNFSEAAAKIHGANYPELSKPFLNDFFKKLTSMDWKSHDDVVDIYFEKLFPFQLCSKDVEAMSAQKLKSASNLTSIARRSWLEAQDELSRCVKVRK